MSGLIRQQAASIAGLLVLYAGLVVWLTWPLGVHVATHRANTHPACGFDPLHMAWALAHETHALTTAPTRFSEANIYFPARRALFYGDIRRLRRGKENGETEPAIRDEADAALAVGIPSPLGYRSHDCNPLGVEGSQRARAGGGTSARRSPARWSCCRPSPTLTQRPYWSPLPPHRLGALPDPHVALQSPIYGQRSPDRRHR